MSAKCERCDRCKRRLRNPAAGGWNVVVKRGVITGLICPDCQTPMENVEAEVNFATLDYGMDEFGRLIGCIKGGSR